MCQTIYKHLALGVAKEMIKELEKNSHKGDRQNWVNLTSKELLSEIYYHTGKLQEAIRDKNKEKIREFCADIANLSGMIMDIEQIIDLDSIDKSRENRDPNIIYEDDPKHFINS